MRLNGQQLRRSLLILVTGAGLVAVPSPAHAASRPVAYFSAPASSRYSDGSTPHAFTTYGRWRAVFTVDDPNCVKPSNAYFYAGTFYRRGPEGDPNNAPHATTVVRTGNDRNFFDFVASTTCAWHVRITNAKLGTVRPLVIASKTGHGGKAFRFISTACWKATLTNLGNKRLVAGLHTEDTPTGGAGGYPVRPHHTRHFGSCVYESWILGPGNGHWRIKIILG